MGTVGQSERKTQERVAALFRDRLHELCHLLERRHADQFAALVDEHLPRWRSYRQELNSTPLAHESWMY